MLIIDQKRILEIFKNFNSLAFDFIFRSCLSILCQQEYKIQYQYNNHSYGFGVLLDLGRLAAGTFLFFSESDSESLSSLESSDESPLVLVSGFLATFLAGSSFELLA
jgi:hypothetical protein